MACSFLTHISLTTPWMREKREGGEPSIKGSGTFKKVIKQYKSMRLLILDEWLLTPLRDQEARDLLEIIEARYQCASTIFCSQFKPGGWHEKIGQDTLADAILDRIIHDSYQIFMDGIMSMRERKGLKKGRQEKG